MTNLTSPSTPGTAQSSQSQWAETVSVFPIYLALAKQLGIAIPILQRKLPETPDPELSTQVLNWLDSMDQRVIVYQLRHLLPMTPVPPTKNNLKQLLERHLRKSTKTTFDRDKIDFL